MKIIESHEKNIGPNLSRLTKNDSDSFTIKKSKLYQYSIDKISLYIVIL